MDYEDTFHLCSSSSSSKVSVVHRDTDKNVSFNLCADVDAPVESKYKLDTPPENSDGSRRNLVVKVGRDYRNVRLSITAFKTHLE